MKIFLSISQFFFFKIPKYFSLKSHKSFIYNIPIFYKIPTIMWFREKSSGDFYEISKIWWFSEKSGDFVKTWGF